MLFLFTIRFVRIVTKTHTLLVLFQLLSFILCWFLQLPGLIFYSLLFIAIFWFIFVIWLVIPFISFRSFPLSFSIFFSILLAIFFLHNILHKRLIQHFFKYLLVFMLVHDDYWECFNIYLFFKSPFAFKILVYLKVNLSHEYIFKSQNYSM
jgi:hypothetical protein